ncbi:phosphoenolpyruvate hydrolase family protein [Candidatus Bathyarchaeota archaeon]|nr:phosphoenolpyruvate hydrolase family protein [Candidatus Bathyarchaeota archaeon]
MKTFIDTGYSGVINFPTVGIGGLREYNEMYASSYRNMGIPWQMDREVEMIRLAREKFDWFSMCYVFTSEDAAAMVKAGCDVVCAHVGATTGGLTGFDKFASVDNALKNAQKIIDGARKVDPNIICLAHGGPFAEPNDTKFLYEKTTAQGFVGASSIERIPLETAIINCVKGFKSVKPKKK